VGPHRLASHVRQVNELEKENDDIQREFADTRLELEKLRIEGERNRLQFEQSAGDYLREKDQSLKRETQVAPEAHLADCLMRVGCLGRSESFAARKRAAVGLCPTRREKAKRRLARATKVN
jgi:hypothetical protein